VVQSVLERIPSADVKVYVVWEPIRPWDLEGAAKKSQALVSDKRSTHFWARGLSLAERFQKPIGLRTEPAWDVYLLYSSGVAWLDASPPAPSDFMHQLSGRLPDDKLLDGERLIRQVTGLVTHARETTTRPAPDTLRTRSSG